MGNSPPSPPKPIEPPVELHVFKGLDGVPMEYSIPEIPEKRKPTDRFFLIVFLLMLTALITLTIYTICYSDLKRLTNGYDNCGNVCGEENSAIKGINCTGKDYRKHKILMYVNDSALINLDNLKTERSKCVDYCETPYIKIMNRCFKTTDGFDEDAGEKLDAEINLIIDEQILETLQSSFGYIIGMVFIALGLCFVILLLFKYLLSTIVHVLMISSMIITTGFAIHVWISKRYHTNAVQWCALILCIIVNVGVFFSRRRINFVIKIFNETTRAIFAMPFLMLIPIWVFILEIVLTYLLVFLSTLYYSSGVLTHIYGPYYAYYPTSLMIFTFIYTFIFYIYILAFLHGCQQVTVAGAISTWYFTREKDNILGSPISESFRTLRKFHLGSVAFGSFIITVMTVIRVIVKGMTKNKRLFIFRLIINCCIDLIEEFVHYVSNQAYIMVAMHGQPFLTSGKRATKLLIENALSTLSVNSAGDFVLWLAKIIVVILTLICGIILDDGNLPFYGVILLIGTVLSALLAHNFFRNFEICVDTIFLCYCEDTFIHDGNEYPYYASIELVTVVDEAKGIVEQDKMYSSIKTDELPQNFV